MILRPIRPRSSRKSVLAGVHGFTLIELLVALGIIALLVAIALPRYSDARRKAHRSEMQSDLRNLISAEEAYFDVYYTYTGSLGSLDFNQTPNVTINFVDVSASGWSARTTHTNTIAECGVYVGTATAPAGIPVTGEGAIACTGTN